MVDVSYVVERKLAGRWIAGPTIDDAIALAKKANRKGIGVIVNYLGEDFKSMHDVADAVGTYIMLIDAIAAYKVNGAVSVKPTAFGLGLGKGLFESNFKELADYAKKKGIFIWVDMEGQETVEATIAVYTKLVKSGNVGICIQAYLKRSMEDAEKIVKAGGIIRLVKGAYSSRRGSGIVGGRFEVSENYRQIMKYLFEKAERFTIGTHDRGLISDALLLSKRHKKKVTYAMLNGIDNRYLSSMAASGEATALYVPFGTKWVGYSYRRLKEIGHARLILNSLFRSQQL
jgi:proline dehydrogenase